MQLQAPDYWQSRRSLALLLYPLSVLFRWGVWLRRLCFRSGLKRSTLTAVPVIVVGNVTVGGAGKTPLVIALVKQLRQSGWRPAVVSRGYGGSETVPTLVDGTVDHTVVGDEALMLARRTRVPVAVGARRAEAAELLITSCDCNVIVSDDGLQHYALERQVEICVVDSNSGLGNGWCLPAGPLREPISRLQEVDFVVFSGSEESIGTQSENGSARKSITKWLDESAAKAKKKPRISGYTVRVQAVVNLQDRTLCRSLSDFSNSQVHAVAAIGNPQKFFMQLRSAGLDIVEHAFADHHVFQPSDLDFGDEQEVLMTEKDSVKCEAWAKHNFWTVNVVAELEDGIVGEMLQRLSANSTFGHHA